MLPQEKCFVKLDKVILVQSYVWVPQDTVICPVLFIQNINDILDNRAVLRFVLEMCQRLSK